MKRNLGSVSVLILIALQLALLPNDASSQAVEARDLDRNLEAAAIPGSAVSGLLGVSISQFFMFAYDGTTQAWTQIPFQVDEKDGTGDFVFGATNGVLDSNDEIVLLAEDLGDRASASVWIDDMDSRAFSRYEVAVVDTSVDPAKWAWGYLYTSTTYLDTVTVDKISYDVSTDAVSSRNYTIDHQGPTANPEDTKGYPAQLIFSPEIGGSGVDILDREKTRLRGTYNYAGINIDYEFTENEVVKTNLWYKDGPVRVLRKFEFKLSKTVAGQTVEIITAFTGRWYPTYSQTGGGTTQIGPEYGVNLIRRSMDFDESASGMYFYNKYNPGGVLIDGNNDSGVSPQLDADALNWMMLTGDPGTYVVIIAVPNIGQGQVLYLLDDANPNRPKERDGTPKTGDGVSYGDAGIWIYGTNVSGSFSFSNSNFYLPPNQDPGLGEQLNTYMNNPLKYEILPQDFLDVVPPARSANLFVTSPDVGQVTLYWQAVADNGSTGDPAAVYDVRYDTAEPFGVDPDTWFDSATAATGEPVPGTPGTWENFTVTGLTPNALHYFALKTGDAAGNWSAVSAFAGMEPLPVELAAFSAEARNNLVILTWETKSETNNLGFDIERAGADGEFLKIGFVPGKGTISVPSQYRYEDRELQVGRYQYRLRQVDVDGATQHSPVVDVEVAAPLTFALSQSYPNPIRMSAQGPAGTNFRFSLPEDGHVSLSVFNLLGQNVASIVDADMRAGYHTVNWDARDATGATVASGVYIYQLVSGSHREVRKLVVMP